MKQESHIRASLKLANALRACVDASARTSREEAQAATFSHALMVALKVTVEASSLFKGLSVSAKARTSDWLWLVPGLPASRDP